MFNTFRDREYIALALCVQPILPILRLEEARLKKVFSEGAFFFWRDAKDSVTRIELKLEGYR